MKHLNTRTQFGFSILSFALCLFLILLCACGDGSGTSDEPSSDTDEASSDTGSIAFSLVWEEEDATSKSGVLQAALAPSGNVCVDYGIETISAEVYNSSDTEVKSRSWSCSDHQGTIPGMPTGSGMYLIVEGTVAGNVDWQGQTTTFTVSAGQTTDAGTVTMNYIGDDTTPPTVYPTTTTPSDGDTNVSISAAITATFSEKMVSASVNASSFTLMTGTTTVSGFATYNSSTLTATFTPESNLSYSTAYTATITTDVQDRAGNQMEQDYTWSFTTAPLIVWFVDGDLTTSGDGKNWTTAFKTIQEAIDAAFGGDEIWIKQGSYNLSGQIEVNKSVAIYAGFDGTESQRDQRAWQINVTTVDGKNAVRCFNVSANATIDGFTITGGYNGSGAGMYNHTNTAPIITNCSFLENHADYGGGMFNNNDASPTVTNCTFQNNSATADGGGMYNSTAEPMVTNCTFNGNSAKVGGGMYHTGESSPKVTICTITGNTATNMAGGIHCYRFASPTITNCTITDNEAPLGGGIVCADYAKPNIINCTITDNFANDYGGGILCHGWPSGPTITNCILWGNTPDNMLCGTAIVADCDIDQDGYEGIDGNINVDPLFIGNGDYHLTENSPCIDAGTSDGAPDKDIDNEERPYGVNVDIGADEYRPLPWPMFHHDARHTGRTPYVGPQDEAVLWTYSTDGEVNSSPALYGNGTIYVGSEDGNLYAINPDGTFKWTFFAENGIFSSPAIGWDGTIYVGSRDYKLYAIRPDGKLKWLYATGGEVNAPPTIGHDGTLYVGSHDGKLYALNPDGTLKCEYNADGVIDSSPAIDPDGIIYVGSSNGRLNALYPDCTLKWISDPPIHGIWTHPALSPDGTAVYHGADDGYFYARNTSDGSVKWKSPFTSNGVKSSPSIGSDGTIYVGTLHGCLWALKPEDGSLKWDYCMSLSAWSSPATGADGTIYFATDYGHVYAMNQDGTVKWVYNGNADNDGHFRSSPAIGSNGTLYIGSTNGMLYAFGKP